MPKSTREEQAERTREAILEAALELFAERGYKGTSTKRIAAAVGVSEGLIFHHFARKRDLLAGIREGRGVLAGQVVGLLGQAHGMPVDAVVPAIAARFVDMLSGDRRDARLFQVMLAESRTDPELRSMFRETSGQVVGALAGYLDARVAAGELRPDLDTRAAAQTLLGGFLWFFLVGGPDDDVDRRARATTYTEGVVDVWMRGARLG